ncbi:hypothetical protein BGZ74_002058 [Mortierella antarctica]|nr:hypothetical protein BGZ74_002058 [Mortierella antarctica]
MSNDTETQTNQSNGEMSHSRGNSSSSCSSPSSTTATAVQSHKQKQSKHKFRHEVKVSSPLPPIQECTLAECIAFLRLENSPTGSSPSSASVVSGDASATQEEPASNESSSTPDTGTSIDSDASSSSPLDCFLGEAVKNHQHRLFILKLERDFSRFLDQTSLESMELPWINSFYRMMIHRVANCFLLERRIDTTQKTITLYRTDQSALPTFRFVDLMQQEEVEEEEAVPAPTSTPAAKPIKVLKRCPPRPATVCGGRSSSSSRAEESRRSTVSIKEREEAYAKARARIFQGTDETARKNHHLDILLQEVRARDSRIHIRDRNNIPIRERHSIRIHHSIITTHIPTTQNIITTKPALLFASTLRQRST